MSVYQTAEIWGRAHSELSPELYQSWGRALGRQVRPKAKFLVGGDTRGSTPEYLEALADGLYLAGADVVELGILPTPMIYFARRRLQADGCAVVTASHSTPETNGLKWIIAGRPPTPEDVARLKHEADAPGGPDTSDRTPGSRRPLDISYDYVGWLQQRWMDSNAASLHLVVDAMHGCLAARARRYLHAVFPRVMITPMRDRPAPDFGGTPADCSRPELLDALAETVDHERADVGIAFDGDGDRLALVDGQGVVLTAEEATCVLLDTFDGELSDRPFVYDLKFSDRMPEVARAAGAEPVAERSGHTFIRTRMFETEAAFGADVGGHYFYGELGGADDALYTACRVIAHLERAGKPLSELRQACPKVYMTPDLRLPVPPDEHEAVIDDVEASWLDFPQRKDDGVRIDFPEGWAMVRSSVSEPALTFRFESADWDQLHKLVWRFCDALHGHGDALWARYEEAMGSRCHPG